MARSLAPGHYAAFIASLSLLAILASPGAIIANLSARTVSTHWSAGSFTELRRLLGQVWIWLGSASVVLSLIFVALSGLIARMLSIQSIWIVIWAAVAVAPALLVPLTAGMLQGSRSFGLLGAIGAIGVGSRLAVGVGLVGLGFGAAGAVAASPIAGFLAVAAGYAGWRWLVRGRSGEGDGALEIRLPVRDQLKVAAIGAVQIFLFNLDILFVKAVFNEQIAADYSAAALIGRTIFLLPVRWQQSCCPTSFTTPSAERTHLTFFYLASPA
jgi:O-antigen/teichoic acid export membrane protein